MNTVMPSKYIKKISLLSSFMFIFSACSFLEYKEAEIKVTKINEELSEAGVDDKKFLNFLNYISQML